MATSRRFVQITDKEINKIKITCVKILKQLFASGSVIIGEYSPRLRLGEYSPIITSPSANNCKIFQDSDRKISSAHTQRRTQGPCV